MDTRMLIVDDEEAILFAMRAYFTKRGYAVDCARQRGEAEALLAGAEYAVVIADLRLSGAHPAEGLEVLGLARRLWPRIRLVLLTAYGSNDLELEARRRGADAFLHKPKSLPEVEQLVAGLLAQPTV
ncbi:MAG TPA: response regulator [Thermoanaerobaculia bacterium]|nr:response regulator [Thermoanaerobaculia bacterium]